MRATLILALSLAGGALSPVHAQTPVPGNCIPGDAERDLTVSDVRATLFNAGNLFFSPSTQAGYLVPAASGVSPLFAAGLWVAGFVGGELRVAGATYGSFEFWPGPLNPGATLPNAADCSAYDRIWVVSEADIEIYNTTGSGSADLLDWPVALGAEVTDGDGVPGNYNLPGGDRPRLYGSQTAFWVMNDVGNDHSNSLTPPIGLEVNVHAFAIDDPVLPTLDRGTFYRYTLINRNTVALEDARVALFADFDLGDASDDYVGTDSVRSLFYVYNADNNDSGGYGTNPPAAGVLFLNELFTAMYFVNGAPLPQRDPEDGPQMYNVMRGRWTDGTPMTEGGTGLNPGSTEFTTYAFGGDPVANGFWSMRCPNQPCGASLAAGDVRMVGSTGFALAPGDARTFDFAILYARGTSNLNSITQLRSAADFAQLLYDAGGLFPSAMNPPVSAAPEPAGVVLDVSVAPNPAFGATAVGFTLPATGHARVVVYDVLGRSVATVADGVVPAGTHEAGLDVGRLAPGVYVVAVETPAGRAAERFTVMR